MGHRRLGSPFRAGALARSPRSRDDAFRHAADFVRLFERPLDTGAFFRMIKRFASYVIVPSRIALISRSISSRYFAVLIFFFDSW